MRRLIPVLLILCLLAACVPARAAQPFTELSVGSRGDAVKALQQRLIALKLLPGKADGLYGQQTRQAVLSFQQHLLKNGYQVTADGRAGEDTQRLLYDDEAAGELLNLKTGDQGTRVSGLQSILYDLRLLDDAPDGAYGKKTEQAIRDFQGILIQSGIAGAMQTGIADQVTRKYLAGDMKGLDIRVPHNFDDTKP
ncbi:MAG: peptidoglycan-binding domain-containing protein, partial [Eubacteriales bacterium]